MIEGHDILCFAPGPWDDIWRNRHQIMTRLARANRVLYVEPWPELRPTLRRLCRAQAVRKDLSGPRLRTIREGLHVFSPAGWAPRSTRLPLRAVTEAIYMGALRRALHKLGFNSPILWLFLPDMGIFVGRFDEKLVIYHIVDEYSGYAGISAAWKPVVQQMEEQLARRADLVVVTSPELLEHKRDLNERVIWVPNAVDYDTFAAASAAGTPPPEDMASMTRPVAGYVGAINDKLDLTLLARTASATPRWAFALVGPVTIRSNDGRQALDELRALANVRFLGVKTVTDVPRYIAACDICLLPYRINEWTRHIDALKLYEYLACGKPVVATDVPAARRLGALVQLVTGSSELATSMDMALANDSPERQDQRRGIARQNTWDGRVNQLSAAIEQRLTEKRFMAQSGDTALPKEGERS